MSFLYSPVTYAALAVLLVLLYALYQAALPKPLEGIPYHKASANRILGDLPSLVQFRAGTDPGSHSLVDWFSKHDSELKSPIFQLFFQPFGKPIVCITDPRESLDILLRRAKEFDRSKFFKRAFSGTIPNHHIIQPTNDKFRFGRRLLADTMTTPFLNAVAAPHLHKHCQYLMELWRVKNQAAQGHAFAIAKDLNHMALDSIWEVAYGSELKTLPSETDFLRLLTHLDMPVNEDDAMTLPVPERSLAVRSMLVVTDALDIAITSPFPSVTHWYLRKKPSYRHARAHQSKLVQERLNDAKQRLLGRDAANPGDDGLHAITCATDHMVRREAQMAAKEGREPVYDSPAAMDELFGFLIAGHETTATSVMWIMRFLTEYPLVQTRLRNALYTTAYPSFAAEDKLPTAEAISARSVPYLDAVMEEILRLSMISIGAQRVTTREVTLLGHRIPKDVDVYVLNVGAGYVSSNAVNETISEDARSVSSREHKDQVPAWNDADIGEFRPERWLKRNDKGDDVFDPNAGPTLQFGGGVRGCFGKKLAYLEMRMLVTITVWTYELLEVPEKLGGFESIDTLTPKPKNCYVRLRETGKGN